MIVLAEAVDIGLDSLVFLDMAATLPSCVLAATGWGLSRAGEQTTDQTQQNSPNPSCTHPLVPATTKAELLRRSSPSSGADAYAMPLLLTAAVGDDGRHSPTSIGQNPSNWSIVACTLVEIAALPPNKLLLAKPDRTALR